MMEWIDSHLVQVFYFFDLLGKMLPAVLTVAVILTFFLIQSLADKVKRMAYYLDRIDNHMREITYFIKEHQKQQGSEDNSAEDNPETESRGGGALSSGTGSVAAEEDEYPARES